MMNIGKCVIPFIQSSHHYVYFTYLHTQGHDNDFSAVFSITGESFWQCGREFKGANYGNYIAKIAACVVHTVYGKIG